MAEGVGRLRARVIAAFVDGIPIDWAALSARSRRREDEQLVAALRELDALRITTPPVTPPNPAGSATSAARVVIAAAAIQVLCTLTLLAAAGTHGVVDFRIPQIVMLLAFAGASVLTMPAAFRDAGALMLVAMFACGASAFAHSALRGLPVEWSAHIAFVMRGLYLEAFAPACLWHFATNFPRVRRFAAFDAFARGVAAAAWTGGLVVFAVNALLAYGLDLPASLALLQRDHPDRLFWHLFSVTFVGGVGAILLRSRRAVLSERRRVAWLAAAMAGGTAPFLLAGLARALLPRVNEWITHATAHERAWLDGLIVSGLTATPILSATAVLVQRPFTHGAAPGASRAQPARGQMAVVVSLSACLLIALGMTLRDGSPQTAIPVLALACAAAWAAAVAVWRSPDIVTPRADSRLAEAFERIRAARGSRAAFATLAEEARAGIEATHACVLTRERGGPFVADAPRCELDAGSALVTMLRATGRAMVVAPGERLTQLLPPAEQTWLRQHGFSLLDAVRAADGEPVAILALATNVVRGSSRRDRWFVHALTMAAGRDTQAAASSAGAPSSRRADVEELAFECPACGLVGGARPLACTCASAPRLAALPARIGTSLAVRRRLGAGSMGVVYLAHDAALGRDVALKTLSAADEHAMRRLREEARAMAAFSHESLATIYGLEVWRGTAVLVVEFLSGGTLADRLAGGPLTPLAAVQLGRTLARALECMHARGMLHRDIKPRNVGFTASGGVKLLDFGLATLMRPADDRRAARGMPAGTPAYLPPEMFAGAPQGAAADLWALAVVIVEAAIGVNPLLGGSAWTTERRLRRGDVSGAAAALQALPPEFVRFAARALARRPGDRFASASDLEAALAALESRLVL